MIYWIGSAEGYEHTGIVNDDDHEIFRRFDGTPLAATWEPVAVERYREGKSWRPADFPFYTCHVLFMRQRAVDVLRDMLEASGEILPLATDDDVDLFALNVTRVIDALDEENSSFERFSESGRIAILDAAAFYEDLVRDVDIFCLTTWLADTLVSQRFVDRVRDAKLTGLKFRLAWSPEGGAVMRGGAAVPRRG